jgi:putative colanic acid biosysnthesis UDP-glucose lipid carrier transferase
VLKTYSASINTLSRLLDPLLVVAAAFVAYFFRFPDNAAELPEHYKIIVVLAMLCVVVTFPLFNLYFSWRGQSMWKQARSIVFAWAGVVMLIIVLLFGLKISTDYSFLKYQRKSGRNVRNVVIVGAGDLAKRVILQVEKSAWTGYRICALFDDNEKLQGVKVKNFFVLGKLNDVESYLASHDVDEVWLALPLRAEKRMKELLYEIRHYTVNIKLIPDIFGFSLLHHSMTEIAGLPAVNLSDSPMGGVNQLVKAVEDRVLGLFIFLLIIIPSIVIAIAIKMTSPGPILFKQKRHGWDGKVINVYKFRTMEVHESNGDIVQASKSDSRITSLGAFLRRTSLDELPQFYNVLQGRMSIVGPRPHAVQHNDLYKNQVDRYMLRHMMKPGITGWAQINGLRGETDTLEKMKKRIEYDLYYIENWSLGFDLKIILKSIFKGFINKNAY